MAEVIVDWLPSFIPAESEFSLHMPMWGSSSPFGGASNNAIIGVPRWMFSITTAAFRKEKLPRNEAFLLRLRNGLNLVRVGDWRYTGMRNLAGGVDIRVPGNLLLHSVMLSAWNRVGPAGVAVGTGVSVSYTSDYYAPNSLSFQAGLSYVLVCDLHSAVSAQVSLSLSAEAFGVATGAIFDALDGSVVSTFGAVVGAGRVALPGGGFRSWIIATAAQTVNGLVHLYPILPAGGVSAVSLDRPQLAYSVGQLPPSYVPTDGDIEFGQLAPRVSGGGQTGDRLNTKGWLGGLTLKAGYWIAYGDGMHRLMDDAQADASGNAQLWIEPPIRLSPADNTAIDFRRVQGLFRLTSGAPGFKQQKAVVPGIAMTFEEQFPE